MNWSPSEKLLTLKDIAKAISFDQSDEGIARTMRQVRHWTQNDLLPTFSGKETGKGIPRLYQDEPTIEIAAILQELSRYGATVDVMAHLTKELMDTDEGYMAISAAQTDEIIAFAQVSWKADSTTGKFIGANVEFFDEYELVAYAAKGSVPLDQDSTSSILINITAVMSRVYKNWRK